MELAKESDNDSESNQVLMYYKNYSQNPELSKYFTGPEASISKPNNPSSRVCLKSTNKSSTFNDHANMISTDPNIILMNHDEDTENKNISPSSSIASNKKLEWDNGADIGYKNSYKHSNIKSASFPSLLINDMTNLIEEKSISKNTQQIRSMYHQLTFSPAPSCSSTKENRRTSSLKTKTNTDTSSSLNESTSKEPSPLSSGSGKNKLYLQRKIGQPVAFSTPYDDAVSSKSSDDFYRETPMLRIQSKPKRNLNENQLESSSGNYTSHDDNPVLHKDKNINNSESSYNAASIENVQQVLGMNKCTEESIQRVSKVQREINLCLTKPIFVECIYSSPKQNTNQKSQTSFALGKNSKSVQTEMIQINNKVIYSNPIEVCTPLIQKIEYVRYKKNDEPNCNMMLSGNINLQVGKTERFTEETNENVPDVERYNCPRNVGSGFKKSSEISEKKKDIKTVTDLESKGEELDKCDYLHDQSENIEVVTTTKGSSIINTNSSISCPENISVKKFEKVFQESGTPVNGSSSVATDKSVSDEMILSEMLSINHSRDLNTDIKRSISILQKLLSSKKYDEATKKYYIKKIVEKIVESKYSGDSTSSSELFRPKKKIVTELDNQDKTHIPNSKSVKSNGSEIKLMQNIPWYPVCDAKYISSKKKKKMDCKRTKADITTIVRELRNTVHSFSKDDADLVMDEKFKITNNSEFLQNKLLMANSKYNTKATATKSSPTYQSSNDNVFKQPHAVASVDKMDDKKWKSVKTLSERLLENRDKIGQGDYLLHVATNERYHQLSWIKNEIEHLNKLKEMLERKIRPKPQVEDVVSSLLKMHVDDLQAERNSGRSYRLNSKPAPEPKPHPTRTRSTSPDSKSDTIFPRTKKVQLDVKVGKDVNIKRKKKHRDELSGSNQLDNKTGIHSALTTQSKLKSLNPTPEKNRDDQAKKVQCCKACKSCNSSSSTSPRPGETQEKYKKGIVRDLQTPPMRENEEEQNVLWKCPPKCQDLNWEKTQSSVKKSCQCCTCTDCGIQTKIYSSSHTPATNFRSSPPDMEVSPNSPRWQRNRTIAGDTASTTQSKNKPQSKQCCCSPETCKCGQTSTHEEKHVQYSAFKQCICQTESEEGAKNLCSCKGDVDIPCKCEKKSCQCVEETVCKCKQSSSSSSSSSSKSLMSCICCKKEKLLKNIMNKLPLCNPCHDIHQKRFYPYEYSNPLHSCLCYSLIDQDTMSELKSTLTELERLEIYQQYCEVLKNCKCCKKCGCKCKLPKKFKNGCAYFLKLEDACPYECGEQEVCNCEDDGDYDEEKKENVLPEVTVKVPNCKGSCAQKKNSEMKMQQNCPSVMAYLCTMKPQFIERAERRRRILRNAALQREEDGETRKLNFLDQVNYLNQKYQNEHVSSETKMCGPYGNQTAAYCVFDIGLNAPTTNIKPRVFKSFKEMKDLTRRRYLHLSEVRNKKDVYKNKRLKEANRILANTFTKRLQRSTLRGNVDIPPCVRVISY